MKKHVDHALNSPSALAFMKAFMNTMFDGLIKSREVRNFE